MKFIANLIRKLIISLVSNGHNPSNKEAVFLLDLSFRVVMLTDQLINEETVRKISLRNFPHATFRKIALLDRIVSVEDIHRISVFKILYFVTCDEKLRFWLIVVSIAELWQLVEKLGVSFARCG